MPLWSPAEEVYGGRSVGGVGNSQKGRSLPGSTRRDQIVRFPPHLTVGGDQIGVWPFGGLFLCYAHSLSTFTSDTNLTVGTNCRTWAKTADQGPMDPIAVDAYSAEQDLAQSDAEMTEQSVSGTWIENHQAGEEINPDDAMVAMTAPDGLETSGGMMEYDGYQGIEASGEPADLKDNDVELSHEEPGHEGSALETQEMITVTPANGEEVEDDTVENAETIRAMDDPGFAKYTEEDETTEENGPREETVFTSERSNEVEQEPLATTQELNAQAVTDPDSHDVAVGFPATDSGPTFTGESGQPDKDDSTPSSELRSDTRSFEVTSREGLEEASHVQSEPSESHELHSRDGLVISAGNGHEDSVNTHEDVTQLSHRESEHDEGEENEPPREGEQKTRSATRPIRLTFNGQSFALFAESSEAPSYWSYDPQSDSVESVPAPRLALADEIYWQSLDQLFNSLRVRDALGEFLEEAESGNELVMSLPELELTVREDSVHGKDVHISDLVQMHEALGLQDSLHIEISEEPSFIGQYNLLASQIEQSATQAEEFDGTISSPSHTASPDEPESDAEGTEQQSPADPSASTLDKSNVDEEEAEQTFVTVADGSEADEQDLEDEDGRQARGADEAAQEKETSVIHEPSSDDESASKENIHFAEVRNVASTSRDTEGVTVVVGGEESALAAAADAAPSIEPPPTTEDPGQEEEEIVEYDESDGQNQAHASPDVANGGSLADQRENLDAEYAAGSHDVDATGQKDEEVAAIADTEQEAQDARDDAEYGQDPALRAPPLAQVPADAETHVQSLGEEEPAATHRKRSFEEHEVETEEDDLSAESKKSRLT
ncbi:unnamed protein product [Parajaminaea phylloscopi]